MADKAILVIDSDSETAQNIEAALESEDYLVFIASTEEFGMTMARKVHPALIFLNPALTGGSGLDICKTIHGIETLGSVPIIAITPFEGELDPRYRSEYGIVDAIGKNFAPDELIAKTVRALSSRPSDEAPSAAEKPAIEDEAQLMEKETPEPVENILHEEAAAPAGLPEGGEASASEDDDLTARRTMRRRRDAGSRLTVPLIAAVILVIVAGSGFFLYKMGLFGAKEVRKPAVAKSVPLDQQKPVQPSPAPEQKPQEPAPKEEPAAVSPPQTAIPSAPAVKEPPKKPAGKTAYSVQLGAFKEEKNAETLAKKYKEKGYDAFVQSVPRDKEMLHRVLIGKFENRKEAWTKAEEIMKKEDVKVTVAGD